MLKAVFVGLALTLAVTSNANAGIIYDADVTPGVLFGGGNQNGSFVVNKAWKNNQNNIELGLRAKVPYEETYNSNGAGVYTMNVGAHSKWGAPGAAWNFEFAINLNYDGSDVDRMFEDYLIELSIDLNPSKKKNWLKFDPVASFNDNYVNAGNSIAQNSMNIGWLGQDFDIWTAGLYDFRLRVLDKDTNEVLAGTKMRVNVVPEPSILSLLALGIIGLASRRFIKQ